MGSHLDRDFIDSKERQEFRNRFLDRLNERADEIIGKKESQITAGDAPLVEWKSDNGINVRQLPDDEQGILRISIGGGDHLPVLGNYVVFRGERGRCIDLLRKALVALETDPQ